MSHGEYPFYTSGVSTKSCDDFLCDGRNLFIATGGRACVQYYEGKAAYSTDCYSLTTRATLAPKFLFYFLESIVEEIEEHMFEGTALRHLQKAKFREIVVPLPAAVEQKRIVGILDEAFEGIATAEANTERNIQHARALFESRLHAIFTQRGEGWVETTIGEHIQFIDYRGKTPKKTESGLRLITAKNVKMGFVQDTPREFVAPSSYDAWMTRGIPQRGDILFTTEAPLGNVAQLDTDEKVVFAQRIIIMHPDPSRIDSTFLKFLLLSPPVQRALHENGTGATVRGIKASLLREIRISLPSSLAEQQRIVAILDMLSKAIVRLEHIYQGKLTSLDSLKNALLHEAFCGQL